MNAEFEKLRRKVQNKKTSIYMKVQAKVWNLTFWLGLMIVVDAILLSCVAFFFIYSENKLCLLSALVFCCSILPVLKVSYRLVDLSNQLIELENEEN